MRMTCLLDSLARNSLRRRDPQSPAATDDAHPFMLPLRRAARASRDLTTIAPRAQTAPPNATPRIRLGDAFAGSVISPRRPRAAATQIRRLPVIGRSGAVAAGGRARSCGDGREGSSSSAVAAAPPRRRGGGRLRVQAAGDSHAILPFLRSAPRSSAQRRRRVDGRGPSRRVVVSQKLWYFAWALGVSVAFLNALGLELDPRAGALDERPEADRGR